MLHLYLPITANFLRRQGDRYAEVRPYDAPITPRVFVIILSGFITAALETLVPYLLPFHQLIVMQ